MGIKLGNELNNLTGALKNSSQDVVGSGKGFLTSVKDAFKNKGARADMIETASSLPRPIRKSFEFAARIVEVPLAYGVKVVRHGVTGVGNVYRKAPLLAVPATLILGGLAINKGLRNRAERIQSENEAMADVLQYQAQQAPTAQATTSYMGSVSPDEAAQLNAQLKDSQGQQGFAENVTAARQASQAQGTPVAAL